MLGIQWPDHPPFPFRPAPPALHAAPLFCQIPQEVINYELPSKIETYCHRIGRTGRAGKDGIATSFLTEHDEEIMFGLKEYLQSTESQVPQQLMKHSAAQAAVGARRDDGSLVNSKRDSVMFAKK